MTLHFLNDVSNDAKSTQKIDHYTIFARLKSEKIEYQVCISRYQINQVRLREHLLNRSASLAKSTSVLLSLPGKLDIKRHSPSILYV